MKRSFYLILLSVLFGQLPRAVLLFAVPLVLSVQASAAVPVFAQWATDLPAYSKMRFACGDFDNDGDLDYAHTGGSLPNNRHGGIYRNQNETFTPLQADITNLWSSTLAWGDYDNDGDLDLILSGLNDSTGVTALYRNDLGTTFSSVPTNLPYISNGHLAWGDCDNDGRPDLALAGIGEAGDITEIHRNLGKGHFVVLARLPGFLNCSLAWNDFDRDGDLDLAVTGVSWDLDKVATRIFRNDRLKFTDLQADIPGVYGQYNTFGDSLAWGDYDGDGQADLIVTGGKDRILPDFITALFRNQSGEFLAVAPGLADFSARNSNLAWGDADNDGDLDLVLIGDDGNSTLGKLLLNQGGAFSDSGAILASTNRGQCAFTDVDGDGRLDIQISGFFWNDDSEGVYDNYIFRNTTPLANAPPTAPENLFATMENGWVTLHWSPSSDDTTATPALTYQLRVGSSPGKGDRLSPMSERETGQRLVLAPGSMGSRLAWSIRGLEEGTYYWSVQAIDAAYRGSPWAPEHSFCVESIAHYSVGLTATPANGGKIHAAPEPDAEGKYPGGEPVVFTAVPEPGCQLHSWRVDDCPTTYTWHPASSSGPDGREQSAMVYDPVRDKTVLFGGKAPLLRGDTWEWNGTAWTLTAIKGPSPREGHAMAYDSRRHKVMLFGGWDGHYRNDLWEWDGQSWQQICEGGPEPRTHHAIAYDSARGKLVLFGGINFSTVIYPGTWEWDGRTWRKSTEQGPPWRYQHAMAYDPHRSRIVLYGGWVEGSIVQDTWEWDGIQWTQHESGEGGPGTRSAPGMAYDFWRRRIILFGGWAGATLSEKADLWEWDGTHWSFVPGLNIPPPRKDHAITYDMLRHELVVFGGYKADGQVYYDDMWLAQIHPPDNPLLLIMDRPHHLEALFTTPRPFAGVMCNPAEGGRISIAPPPEADGCYSFGTTVTLTANPAAHYSFSTWSGDAVGTQTGIQVFLHRSMQCTANFSPMRYALTVGIDPPGAGIITHIIPAAEPDGKYTAGTSVLVREAATGMNSFLEWKGDGVGSPRDWTRVVSATIAVGRNRSAMAYDPVRRQIILFGGLEEDETALRGDTLTWDGQTWSAISTSGPSPRYGHSMVTDWNRRCVVLFGGHDGMRELEDTWEWNGHSWTLSANTGPPARAFFSMAFDAHRNQTILFGGAFLQGNNLRKDTWEWDGLLWRQRADSGPSQRMASAMAYDDKQQKILMVGGLNSQGRLEDTWLWDGTAWTEYSGAGPGPQSNHLLIGSRVTDQILLVGGEGTLWAWKNSQWLMLSQSGPGNLLFHAGAEDRSRGRIVVNDLYSTWEWGGNAINDEIQINLDGERSVTACYRSLFHLTLTSNPPNGGFISANPTPVVDNLYVDGTQVELAAQAAEGFRFHHWSGDIPSTPSWTALDVKGPPPRTAYPLVWDTSRNRAVVFGGVYGTTLQYDFWDWSGTAWESSIHRIPPARSNHCMVYDSGRERLVLFGGQNSAGVPYDDTHEFSGRTWVFNTTGGPPPRYDHAMAYDERRGKTVLFGGFNGTDLLGDTWEWDGSTWVRIPVSGPAPRAGHVMGWHALRHRVVLFGGKSTTSLPVTLEQDTWEWDGNVWRPMATLGPAPRMYASMAWNPFCRRIILYGGLPDPSSPNAFRDLWQWDGLSWTQLPGQGPAGDFKMVANTADGTLLFLGISSAAMETWIGRSPTSNPFSISVDRDTIVGAEFRSLLPEAPANPRPANGTLDIDATTTICLYWASCEDAETYQFYLWPEAAERPTSPTLAGFIDPSVCIPPLLYQGVAYLWQVMAINAEGQTLGPEWHFTTRQVTPTVSPTATPLPRLQSEWHVL